MNKQQYNAIRHNFRERHHHMAHVMNFPEELRRDAVRLFKLRDGADMLACRAEMAEMGVYALRMRLTHCTPRRVLTRLYGAAQ